MSLLKKKVERHQKLWNRFSYCYSYHRRNGLRHLHDNMIWEGFKIIDQASEKNPIQQNEFANKKSRGTKTYETGIPIATPIIGATAYATCA